jgi:cell division protein FtsB
MQSHETRVIAQLRRYGALTDDLIAKLADLPPYIAKAARRRLVRRGEIVRRMVFHGRVSWKLAEVK